MTIKHLVIGGGGPGGFINYGALKESNLQGIWKYDDIKTIYATSAGGFIALPIILKINWNWIDDYIIKRPWNKVFQIDPIQIFDIYKDKGIYDTNAFRKVIEPLLKAKDISPDITLNEFYTLALEDFGEYKNEVQENE